MNEISELSGVIREFGNGFIVVFFVCIAILFLVFSFKKTREEGRFGIEAQAAAALASVLFASIIARIWVWIFLWQENHGYGSYSRVDWLWAVASVIMLTILGPWLIYTISPRRRGIGIAFTIISLSWLLPLLIYWFPFIYRWTFG